MPQSDDYAQRIMRAETDREMLLVMSQQITAMRDDVAQLRSETKGLSAVREMVARHEGYFSWAQRGMIGSFGVGLLGLIGWALIEVATRR